MTQRPSLPRVVVSFVRRLLSERRADAILDDLDEELDRRMTGATSLRWPRMWLWSRATLDVGSAAWSGATIAIRTHQHVVRDAWRSLRSTPTSSLFAFFVLAIGMAAATVTFSVVDAVILRPYPFGSSKGLAVLTGPHGSAAAMEYEAWRDGASSVFDGVAASNEKPEILPLGSTSVLIRGAEVTPNLFDLLHARPLIGRTFTASDVNRGPGRVVIIGYWFWRRYFNGAADVLGRQVPFKSGPATVVAVMPEGFTYPLLRGLDAVGLWTPYVVPPDAHVASAHGVARYSNFMAVGRLKPGVSLEQASTAMWAAVEPIRQQFSFAYDTGRPRAVTMEESLFGAVRGWMLLVLSSVGLVMAIACINVANLLLIRSQVRTRELAIRAALGAGRGRLIVALLVESLLLSIGATIAALVLASWATAVARDNLPAGIIRASTIALDSRVFAIAILTAIVNGIVFGLVPAWQASRTEVVTLLKESTPASTAGRRRWRSVFLVSEVACICALLVVTTLFVTSFVRVVRLDLGFSRANLVDIDLGARTPSVAATTAVFRGIPGVVDVAAVGGGSPPLVSNGSSGRKLRRTDGPATMGIVATSLSVSPEYFRTAAIRLIQGRSFDAAYDRDAVILDTTAAARIFGDANPVGRLVSNAGIKQPFRVIAIAGHVKSAGPDTDDVPQAYFLIEDDQSATYLVRSAPAPQALLPALTTTAGRFLPPGRQPQHIVVVEDAFRALTADRRFNASVMGIFGLVSVLIGAAGVYGVMASTVAQRRRELAVRVALGATTGRVERDVLRQTTKFLAVGLAIGLPAGWWASRFFASLLFAVTPSNAATYFIDAFLLIAVGLAAALIPARRAARVDPIEVLKAS
jgi:predicted permease